MKGRDLESCRNVQPVFADLVVVLTLILAAAGIVGSQVTHKNKINPNC